MDMDMHSSHSERSGAKAAFRKPSNDPGNRKYRRRSPVNGSSSSDGDVREGSSTPTPSRDDAKHEDNKLRKDDKRDIERDHRRSHHSRDGGSYRDADRASRSSYNHHRHEDYKRREKYVEEDHKNFSKSSPRSGSGTHGSHSDHSRRESEHYRSRDSVEKYTRDKSDGSGHRSRDKHKRDYVVQDEKRDYQKSERSPTFKESRGPRAGHRLKEASWDSNEINDRKYTDAQKGKYYDRETNRHKERNKDSREFLDDGIVLGRKALESSFKKPKWGSMEKDTDHSKDASKHVTVANEVQSSSTTQGPDFIGEMNPVQQCVKESDIDAAKIAAMKAAELVNRNLIGTGYMSTDQKKKLLWGSKKTTTTEETAHRWDTSMFSDRERQEKFNKLMGVKGEAKVEQKPEVNLAEKQKELQLDLEKQYTAGLRRRDGRTVGLGL